MKASILIVDDDDIFRERLGRALANRDYEVHLASDADEAIRLAKEESPEFAVVDLRLGTTSGLDVVSTLRDIDSATRTVVLTGFGSIATALEAVRLGAHHYLTKPANTDEILAALVDDRENAPQTPREPTEVPSLARVEWEHIQRVLSSCDGNISQAAKLLGLHRRSLQRKLAKYPARR
ncbi:MAG: response regulator [Myxococcales bacterium]|nr:response regulator [Myxococcales bacterium]